MRDWRKHIIWTCALGSVAMLSGCTRDGRFQAISMWNESRLKPYEESPFPEGGSSSRVPPAGTVARGQLASFDPISSGRGEDGKLVTRPPVAITEQTLARGQERFNVYCSPCHSRLGDGNGMVVLRGFPPPPDYGLVRLRQAPIGHLYDVITNGYGVMYSYADRVSAHDRWAIAAYIRVLQKTRPVLTKDETLDKRKRARLYTIQEPNRPMRVNEEGEGGGNPAQPGGEGHTAPGSGEHVPGTAGPQRGPASGQGGTEPGLSGVHEAPGPMTPGTPAPH